MLLPKEHNPEPDMTTSVAPSNLDAAVDAAIAAVTAQVAAVEAQKAADAAQATEAPKVVEVEPDAPPAVPPLIMNGVLITPETHLFDENGQVMLTPTGRARIKPGTRKAKATTGDAPLTQALKVIEGIQPVSLTDTGVAGAPAAPAVTYVPTPAPAPAPVPQTVKPTTATVTTVYGKIGLPATKDEEIAVRTFVSTPAMVEIGYGLTLNIGNYESARIDVRISLPCYPEEADGAFAFAKKWTEERIQTEVKEIRKIASGTKNPSTPF